MGHHSFTYSYYPHAGTWQTGRTVEEAFKLNFALKGIPVSVQNGTLPETQSYINCNNDDIVIDAVKQAQDGNGIIVRVYQSRRVRGERTLTINLPFKKVYECNLMEVDEKEIDFKDNKITFNVTPFEVKTFRLV